MGNPDLSVDSKAYFRKLAYSWSRCWCRDKEMGSVYLQAPTTLKQTADLSSFLRHSSNSPWSHHINSLTFWLAQHLATHWRQYSGVRQTGSERGKQLVCLAPGCCTASFSGSGLDTTHTHTRHPIILWLHLLYNLFPFHKSFKVSPGALLPLQ